MGEKKNFETYLVERLEKLERENENNERTLRDLKLLKSELDIELRIYPRDSAVLKHTDGGYITINGNKYEIKDGYVLFALEEALGIELKHAEPNEENNNGTRN